MENQNQPFGEQTQQQPIIINNTMPVMPAQSPKSKTVAGLLCFFLGYLGIHRFYAGKIGTGILCS